MTNDEVMNLIHLPKTWAIPLADDFPVKSVANANGIFPATRAFARKINLKTEFENYQDELIL